MIKSSWILLRMRNVSYKFEEKIEARILCPKTFFFLENHVVFKRMWKNIVEPDRPQMKMWLVAIICRLLKVTHTHTKHTHTHKHTQTHTVFNTLLFHGINGCKNPRNTALYVQCLSCYKLVTVNWINPN